MFISNLRISLLSSSYLFNLFLKPLFENKSEQNFIFLTTQFFMSLYYSIFLPAAHFLSCAFKV